MSPAQRLRIRPATTADVHAIRRLVDTYAPERRLLSKATVTLYEDVPEFVVGELDGEVVACGAVHVMWEDLAEVRTVAVDPSLHGQGVGGVLLDHLVARARDLGVKRVFCLTFETEFFGRHGFHEIDGTPVDHDVFEQLLQSYDEGVAEFLDLERVKPNTLGNHRMLLVL
jgi:amino-acid N-acetyltransferase